jgi:hypothetical protein
MTTNNQEVSYPGIDRVKTTFKPDTFNGTISVYKISNNYYDPISSDSATDITDILYNENPKNSKKYI